MIVDYRESRLLNHMRGKLQLRARREVAEMEIDFGLGTDQSKKLVLAVCILAAHICSSTAVL